MHVIVIGGGFAGLAAATGLADAGHQVTLVERRHHFGGRAFPSESDPAGAALCEPAPRVFFGSFRAARAFLARIGTAPKLHFPPHLLLGVVDCQSAAPEEHLLKPIDLLPAPLDRLGALASFGGLSLLERGLLLRVVAALGSPSRLAPAPGPDQSVAAWLAALGQPQAVCARLWHPLARLTLQDEPTTASATLFAAALRAIFLGAPEDACIAVPSTDAQQLYVDDACQFLRERGARLRPGTEVVQLDLSAGGTAPLDVRLASGETVHADAVVCAIPPHVLWALLPQAVQRQEPYFASLLQLQSAPAVTVHVRLDRVLAAQASVVLIGSPFHWIFQRDDGDQGGCELWLQAWNAPDLMAMPDDALIALGTRELQRAFASLGYARVLAARAIREPDALIAHPAGSERIRPSVQTPIRGLFLCGEFVRTGLPANLESAARSAEEMVWLMEEAAQRN